MVPTNETVITKKFFHQTISTKQEKVCAFCKTFLIEPYIECSDCPNFLCLKCFACGKEVDSHQNSHSYAIIHDNIQVFPNSDWTANEEKHLLELIVSLGYGNWKAISEAIKTRSPEECENHYKNYYFDGVFKVLGLRNDVYRPIRTPYFFKLNTMNPPRTDNSDIAKNMSGYRAARGDFDIPFDISAESEIEELDGCIFGDWPENLRAIGEQMQCAILNSYNHRLR